MLADPILHHDHDALHMTAIILTSKLEIPMTIRELRAVAARPRRVRGVPLTVGTGPTATSLKTAN
ncbi:MAG: hypothetical protein DSY88_03805 [Candidatus Poseidoniales archaeon]|jgi:hypothetical protein|nr:MAG: hypothetical protein DSY88_03805 [Candidatus Poseidoniales archaeon]